MRGVRGGWGGERLNFVCVFGGALKNKLGQVGGRNFWL